MLFWLALRFARLIPVRRTDRNNKGAEMQYVHDFIARVARDVKIVEAIGGALFAMELIHQAEFNVEGEDGSLDFSCEIEQLKGALRILGVSDDEDIIQIKL